VGKNAKDVIDRVKQRIAEISPGLPAGVQIEPAYDRAELIEASVNNLEHTLIEESIIVAIVVLLFLFHFPSALRIVIEIPVSVLIAFILMRMFDITSNIMSLGGIAIAIGVLVDASIVLVENAHRHLEEAQQKQYREGTAYHSREVIIRSVLQVAKPIFFSILIIVVSFLPVFMLTGQEGKLFHPLAFTKTFSLFASAIVSITLMPVLMVLFPGGKKMRPEEKNPISYFFQKRYAPILAWSLHHRKTTIGINLLALAVAIPVVMSLGSEFMPPLDEGSLLFMPLLAPDVSMPEATRILQQEDAIIKNYPEVQQVLGKVGRAETATDPAPESMIETIIQLKPRDKWRPGITKEKIVDDLNRELRLPGAALSWTQPIINRINMLTTGVRTDLGLKIFGDNLDTLERLSNEAAALLQPIPGASDVSAEQVSGGSFLVIAPRPDAERLYGITPGFINNVIEGAVGGIDAGTVVKGRERYPITIRYLQGYRGSVEELKQLPVAVPIPTQVGQELLPSQSASNQTDGTNGSSSSMASMGGPPSTMNEQNVPQTYHTQKGTAMSSASLLSPTPISNVQFVPLGELATVEIKDGPAMVESENAMLRSIVFLDVRGRDMGSFVAEAKSVLAKKLHIPVGYTLSWSGEYEAQEHAAAAIRLLVPLVFLVIFLLLYITFRDVSEAGIVMLSLPFALIGGVFLVALLGMNWSVATWVGFIALNGVATETGVVMIVYLHEALDKKLAATSGTLTPKDIYDATIEGAVLRLRPKLMTVFTAMLGLVPILYSTGTGADVMKPIAAPMVGGMLTSAINVLIVTPILFYLVKLRALRKGTLLHSEGRS
ncbi:MAG TPA: efflux RND transporter permease subunit, partial [Candidatus Kapabacteria bacterium]|nr:efflux RND transporter permease subunit [Candidatus Kapabacteria bacterium]